MNIRLEHITIQSFKGLKQFETDFNGQTVIQGANGSGKTTIYDAFLWLCFSKDSTGRKDFEVRPLDSSNRPVKGVEVVVEAAISFDGISHTLRKVQVEKKVKGIVGYVTEGYIDEVPKKVGEYAEWIAERVPEDTFKTLTDLHYFGEKMHWRDRRAVLLSIAGPVGSPKGFDDLLAKLNGRAIEDYKKVLAGQKVKLIEERDEINPRIDELQRGCSEYVGVDETSLTGKRNSAMLRKQTLDGELKTVLDNEQARQKLIARVNGLRKRQIARESELANDTTGVTHLLAEKASLDTGVSAAEQAVNAAKSVLQNHDYAIKSAVMERDSKARELDAIRKEYTAAKDKPIDNTCYACGQTLPADKVAAIEAKRQATIADIEKRGLPVKAAVKELKTTVERLEAERTPFMEAIDQATVKIEEAKQYRTERLIVIDSQLKSQKRVEPKNDTAWKNLQTEIDALEKTIGPATGGKIAELRTNLNLIDADIQTMNKSLAQADRNRQDTLRIKELADNEAKLSQQIADIDKQVDEIGKYQQAESNLIEAAVNGRFKHVTFKLFDRLLNGSIEPCCEAMLDGVPYSDCSYGQKIRMGMDIINVLSAHYGLSVPMFLDNSESLTYPIETEAQVICLFADADVEKLTVQTQTEKAVA